MKTVSVLSSPTPVPSPAWFHWRTLQIGVSVMAQRGREREVGRGREEGRESGNGEKGREGGREKGRGGRRGRVGSC